MNEQNQRDSIMSMARGAFNEHGRHAAGGPETPEARPARINTHNTEQAVLSIGDAIAMPLRDNIPDPPTDDWQLTTCPACGAECWQTDTVRRILEQEPKARTVCTACALKGLGK